jgi:hypothetical protein
VYEGLQNGEILGLVGEPLVLRYADKAQELIPQALPFTPSLESKLFKANANYFLAFRLNEYGIAADATENTAVGFNDVKINGVAVPNSVAPVPEPLTIFGTGTALGLGVLFKKRELSKKQKVNAIKA